MSTLKGSERRPPRLQNPNANLAAAVYNPVTAKEVDQQIQRVLRWREFKKSPHGQKVYALAGPVIEYLQAELARSITDYVARGWSPEAAEIQRAEYRGQLSVWYDLLYNMKEVEERLEKLLELESRLKEQEAKNPRKQPTGTGSAGVTEKDA